jgi:hypothetical protein
MTTHHGALPRALRALTAALAFCALAASADPATTLPYTYLDVDLITIDAGGGSQSGIGVDGSYAFNSQFYGVAAISDVDTVTSIGVGAGLHGSLSENLHIFGELSVLSVDTGGGSDTGFALGGGLRGSPAARLELFGRVDHVDIGAGSDESLTVGGVYYFDRVGVNLGFTSNDGADSMALGVRFTF